MTPSQIKAWVEKNLHRLDQPSQYLGDEPNSERRDWDSTRVRWMVSASWPYFQQSGNQSIPAVYTAIHRARPQFLADRWYLQETPRDMRAMERDSIPCFGVESRHEWRDFDVVGTSVSYVVLFANFFKSLSMSGIPPRRADRERVSGEHPMVLVGGQSYCAPEFLASVADAIWCGEAEDEPGNPGIGAVCSRIEMFKDSGSWRDSRGECYEELAREFPFLYFPRFFDVQYGYQDRPDCGPQPSKQVTGYTTLLDGMACPVVKRYVHDLDAVPPLDAQPLLYSDPGNSAGDLELQRGCPAWCSFCRLSWASKPPRQRSVESAVEYGHAVQRNMGSRELNPFGPDWFMATNKKRVVQELLRNVSANVDSSTVRVDDFTADPQFIALLSAGGMDTVTVGVEGGSQRSRDLVGKGVSDEEIVRVVATGIRAGIRKFKLYMITNLPGEDHGDLERLLALGRRLAETREALGQPHVVIQFSWTPLLIEAGTPFQWFAPTPPDHSLIEVLNAFRKLRILTKIGTKADPAKLAFFQLCQRASREAGEAVADVLASYVAEGGGACWGGVPKDMAVRLEAALRERGFLNGLGDLFDERDEGDLFGWEFISTGVSDELLWNTYRRMREFAVWTDSATYDSHFGPEYHGAEFISRCDERCLGNACGVCSQHDLENRQAYIKDALREGQINLHAVKIVDQSSIAGKLRIRIERPAAYRTVTNAHRRYLVRRAAFRAVEELGSALPPGTTIAKQTVAFASDAMTYKDWTAGTDYLEFGLTRPVGMGQAQSLVNCMTPHLVPWLVPGDWSPLPASASVRGGATESLFSLPLSDDLDKVQAWLERWDASEYVKLVIRTDSAYFGLGSEEVNARDRAARDGVSDLWVVRDGREYVLRMLVRGRAGPYQAYAALANRASWIDAAAQVAFREGFFAYSQGLGGGLLNPPCVTCGLPISSGLLSEPFDPDYCPRCKDEAAGKLIAGLTRLLPV